jgi:aldehyde dehydrogenase (NAD+)
VVNQRAAVRLTNLIKKDQQYVRFGGRSEVAEKYIEPTCLDFKSDWAAFKASEAMSDEIFGPIIPVMRWKTADEIIDYINSGEKSLALYVFTTDADTAERVLTETTSGGAVVNDCITHLANANLPFGGVGKSGMGSYHGKKSFESFSHIKSVIKKTNWFDAPQRYPPYKKDLLMELALTPIPARIISVAKTAILIASLTGLTRVKRRITLRPDLIAIVAAFVWLLRMVMLQPPKRRLAVPRKA